MPRQPSDLLASLVAGAILAGAATLAPLCAQVAVTANYQMSEGLYLSAGWRQLYVT